MSVHQWLSKAPVLLMWVQSPEINAKKKQNREVKWDHWQGIGGGVTKL